VDLTAGGGLHDTEALAAARTALSQLSCVSVARCIGETSAAGVELLDRFDLVASSEEEFDLILASVERSPLAAVALVQLLRHSESLDFHEGLIAESLTYSTLQGGPEFAAWAAEQEAPRRRKADAGPVVLVRREGEVLHLRLNQPSKRNAFSSDMRDALVEALQMVVTDSSIRQVVLSGEGPSFCSGGDLDEFGTYPDPATAHAIRCTRNPARILAACADRVRVEVHGSCIGAGIELPAFAAHVVSAEDALFQLPEVGMGLVPGAGGTVSIPRRIGRQRAAYLAISGIPLDARTAEQWGLVDEVRAQGQDSS
jgi:enoyl-CoA hydratase/carnithine racemase